MKQVVSLVFVFLLVTSPLFVLTGTTKAGNNAGFSPQNIVLSDDAFHGRQYLPFTEWWYFDAIFNNGYSVEMDVRIGSALGRGFVFERFDIHYNNTMIADQKKTFNMTDMVASTTVPFVQLDGNTILSGTQNTTTGNFEYNVSFEFPGYAAELHFVGCTQGWKGQQKTRDWWVVALPRADVTGTIVVNNETIPVSGIGYHDHNWEVTPKSFLRFGWFWGKFNSLDYTMTWSALLPTRATMKPILVLNTKNGGYLSIPSQDIWFSVSGVHLDHLVRVPSLFTLGTMTDTVFLHMSMEVIHVDYTRYKGILDYWRFYVKCSGNIFTDGHAETINDVCIAEYIRFR